MKVNLLITSIALLIYAVMACVIGLCWTILSAINTSIPEPHIWSVLTLTILSMLIWRVIERTLKNK